LFPKKIDGNTTIGVCVFGKHPAYADHLPLDLGDTGMLATRLRQTFYTNGLLTRVSDFDMLQKAGRAIPFGHFILYRDVDPTSPGAALIQLWPSRDSANRADIPMALAAVGGGVTIDWLLTQGADVLAEAEVRCKAAANMPELTGAIRAAGESLRNRAASAEGQSSGEDRTARAVARLGGDAGDESHRLRIVATLRAMRDYLPSGALERSATFDKPAAVRVSRAGQSPLEALADWSAGRGA